MSNGVVYLSSEAEFRKREAGKPALEPVGFPVSDVFAYDVGFLKAKNHDWNALSRWQPVRLVV